MIIILAVFFFIGVMVLIGAAIWGLISLFFTPRRCHYEDDEFFDEREEDLDLDASPPPMAITRTKTRPLMPPVVPNHRTQYITGRLVPPPPARVLPD